MKERGQSRKVTYCLQITLLRYIRGTLALGVAEAHRTQASAYLLLMAEVGEVPRAYGSDKVNAQTEALYY